MQRLEGDRVALPSYLDQAPAVAAYHAELRARVPVMEVVGLGKRFVDGVQETCALEDIEFRLRDREFVSVIGPSGCGKSTLIRILAGLEQPSSGEVRLDGHCVDGPGADRGMVFQGYTLFPWLNVRENVMFGLRMKGVRRREARAVADRFIALVGLQEFSEHYPAQLSGGMKQRVAIARALANEPRILLMDEPFGALDAQTRSAMQFHLLELWRELEISILFITHDLDEAIYLSDRVIVLDSRPGRIREIIEVPLPRPRRPDQFLTGHFLATKQRLEQLIHPTLDHRSHAP